MKLFQKLLVASTAASLITPLAAQASDAVDLEEMNIDQSSVENFSRQLNLIIENKIRLHPHEYLWQHRRFKSTLGKKKIYQ